MKYKINLLSLQKEKPLDRLIFFALNYLRYILVITQIVVISVFFTRFKVDQEIVDLEDSIRQKKEIIEISLPLLNEAKNVAFKINQAEVILTKQRQFSESIDYLLSMFPEKFILQKFQITGESITMEGYTQDFQTIKSFFARVKKEQRFAKIELKNIKKSDLGLEFSFEFNKFKGV